MVALNVVLVRVCNVHRIGELYMCIGAMCYVVLCKAVVLQSACFAELVWWV